MKQRRILFVTGTRAEFGLMERTLQRLRDDRRIDLRLVVTGMHLSREHGRSVDAIRRQGWTIDATVPWRDEPAAATGRAIAGLTAVQRQLNPDVVLVVGDRVEAFAAATAAHLDGRVSAHVHGGDRALGQVDDALRHAISKLSHVHFAATKASGRRLVRMGEDAWRVHVVGTPGLDAVGATPGASGPPYAVVILHPDDADDARQAMQARRLAGALRRGKVDRGVIVYPNNDPGWRGIADVWAGFNKNGWTVHRDLPREAFLELLGGAGLLIGNSSSGIIEAASLGTRVINIGPRQLGRERSANVIDVGWDANELTREIATAWNGGRPRAFTGRNVYGTGDAGGRITDVLATLPLDARLRRKLIAY